MALAAASLTEDAALPAEDATLRTADDAASDALDAASDALERAEAADSLNEPTSELAEAIASLAKMVVLPTVLVMVLPSVVTVVRISEVVIAAAWLSQLGSSCKKYHVHQLTPPAAVSVAVDAAESVIEELAVTAEAAAPVLENVPLANESQRKVGVKGRMGGVPAAGAPQYCTAYCSIAERSVPGGQDWEEQSRTPKPKSWLAQRQATSVPVQPKL